MSPKVAFVVSSAVAAWIIYDLIAPGERMSTAVLVMNWMALIGCLFGAVGAVIQMQKAGRQP